MYKCAVSWSSLLRHGHRHGHLPHAYDWNILQSKPCLMKCELQMDLVAVKFAFTNAQLAGYALKKIRRTGSERYTSNQFVAAWNSKALDKRLTFLHQANRYKQQTTARILNKTSLWRFAWLKNRHKCGQRMKNYDFKYDLNRRMSGPNITNLGSTQICLLITWFLLKAHRLWSTHTAYCNLQHTQRDHERWRGRSRNCVKISSAAQIFWTVCRRRGERSITARTHESHVSHVWLTLQHNRRCARPAAARQKTILSPGRERQKWQHACRLQSRDEEVFSAFLYCQWLEAYLLSCRINRSLLANFVELVDVLIRKPAIFKWAHLFLKKVEGYMLTSRWLQWKTRRHWAAISQYAQSH